jgi:outer membrane lipoprotein carrier protein
MTALRCAWAIAFAQIALSTAFASTASAPVQSEVALDTVVQRIEAHYDSVSDFEAEFTQRYERRLLRRVVEETGHLAVKKPGRMRWEYRTPSSKLFLTDGSRSYFYLPEEKQVMVSHNPEGAMGMHDGSPFEILAGRSQLSESFEFFASESEPRRGGVMLHLVPIARQDEFEAVEVEADPASGRLLRVSLTDVQGNRTEFLFHSVRENVNLSEDLFRFTIPSGVEVVVQSETPKTPKTPKTQDKSP